jgi:homoserine dehydrogenase
VSDPIIVLKFGGSVLLDELHVRAAAEEVSRFVREGYRVVAVVSALEGTTDRLLSQAKHYGPRPHEAATATLLATGELTSTALLGLALDALGVSVETLDAAGIGLRTSGDVLDSSPVALDVEAVRGALSRVRAIVTPGFVGRDDLNRTTLLGRGGSDLTALFIARRLGASCRLVKDVDGLYEWDPAKAGPAPRRYESMGWEGALALDGTIVQHKAVRWAREHGLAFEVGALGDREGTRVGPYDTAFAGQDAGEEASGQTEERIHAA